MAGYAEGARQAQAERAADLASQKATWAAATARAGAMVSQLASATEEYLAHFGPRDGVLTEQLIRAAFELAEAVVTCELRTSRIRHRGRQTRLGHAAHRPRRGAGQPGR